MEIEADLSSPLSPLRISPFSRGRAARRPPGRRLQQGRYVRSRAYNPGEPRSDLAVDATLRQAALRLSGGLDAEDAVRPPWRLRPEDLRRRVRSSAGSILVVLLVDTSQSMGTHRRIAAAKGAAIRLLAAAYRRRYRVAVVAFRERHARVLLPPTASLRRAESLLRRLSTGGPTPLAEGLYRAWELIRCERLKRPGQEALLLLLSDGEANVPMNPRADPLQELEILGKRIRQDRIAAMVPDAGQGRGSPLLARLALALGASRPVVRSLGSAVLLEAVRSF